MYKKHFFIIIILLAITVILLMCMPYEILDFNRLGIANILGIITGFNITGLTILLSGIDNKKELFKFDLHRPKQKEIHTIISYYKFSIVTNLTTIFLLLFINIEYFKKYCATYAEIIYIIIMSMVVVSIYSFYLCFKILLVVFTKDREY